MTSVTQFVKLLSLHASFDCDTAKQLLKALLPAMTAEEDMSDMSAMPCLLAMTDALSTSEVRWCHTTSRAVTHHTTAWQAAQCTFQLTGIRPDMLHQVTLAQTSLKSPQPVMSQKVSSLLWLIFF